MADQVIRMLDEDAITPSDRLRLIALFILFKHGVLPADIRKLLMHAKLPVHDETILFNLELLGARISKQLKDSQPLPNPLFPRKQAPPPGQEEIVISRYDPALKVMLEEHMRGTLDPILFPFVLPDLAASANDPASMSAASLRSAKPTWAKSKGSSNEARQRIIVFMAGGATYSEARACYEITEQSNRDVLLVTSHMLTPKLFLQQLGDLSTDRRRLNIPADRPAKRAPAHLFEEEKPPAPAGLPSGPGSKAGFVQKSSSTRPSPQPPVDRMGAMNLNGGQTRPGGPIGLNASGDSKASEKEKKKKHHFFGSSKR